MLELEFELAVTQFELAFELAPEQFELDFDLAASASNSNSNSHPPRGKKNKLSESGLAVHMLELQFELAVTQFELAFELAPEQFELDFDLAAAASNSNSHPPRREKKTFPSMHSRSSSERLRAVSREVRCQELIFFRIRLRGEIWHVTNASIQEIIFLLGYQRGKFIGCWTLGTRKLAKQIQKGGWK